MKKIIAILVTVIICIVGSLLVLRASSAPESQMASIKISAPSLGARVLAGIKAPFTNGSAEIQRAIDARKSVKSFRMKTVLQLHPGHPLETVVEVSCPDRERFTTENGSVEACLFDVVQQVLHALPRAESIQGVCFTG